MTSAVGLAWATRIWGAYEFGVGLIFTVTNNNNSGPGSLRQALLEANANPGDDVIEFTTNPVTLSPISPLPTITETVTIDFQSAPGLFTLDGGSLGPVPMLVVDAPDVVIQGGEISNSGSSAIRVTTNGADFQILNMVFNFVDIGVEVQGVASIGGGLIQNSFFGFFTDGLSQAEINSYGILLNNSSNVNILNCLIGHTPIGISVEGSTNIFIDNCIIGLDFNENTLGSFPNNEGIVIRGGSSFVDISNNVISGNTLYGISLSVVDDINIINNFIGTNSGGTLARGNGTGIYIEGFENILVEGNIISANDTGISSADVGILNLNIRNNRIGTDASGNVDLGNLFDGIALGYIDNSTIENNVISANGGNGILIFSLGNNLQILNNQIGSNLAGNAALTNGQRGIEFFDSGSSTIRGNQISGNGDDGLALIGAFNNIISENLIGTDLVGINPLPNGAAGIFVDGATSTNNEFWGNIIGYNNGNGIQINAGSGNEIYANFISPDYFHNKIFCNAIEGIGLATGANGNQATPIIINANTTAIQGTCALCTNGDLIDIYSDNSQACTPPSSLPQARVYVGQTIVVSGNWSLNSGSFVNTPNVGDQITATSTLNAIPRNTSEFALPITFAAPSTTVTNTNNSGPGSLREAITNANLIPGVNTIDFNLPGGGTLVLASALPVITDELIMDFSTLGANNFIINGNGLNINILEVNAPNFQLLGPNAVITNCIGSGLLLRAGSANFQVQGLLVNTCTEGIRVLGNISGGTLDNCTLGLDITATSAAGNQVGIVLDACQNINLINSVISGNDNNGLEIINLSSNILVQNNRFGSNISGTAAIANNFGLTAFNALNLSILDNLISGNTSGGINIDGLTGTNQITDNLVGTDVSGTTAISNGGPGLNLLNSANVSISNNTFSGNGFYGAAMQDCSEITFQNNRVGTNSTGTVALANTPGGVVVANGSNFLLDGNVISGNNGPGLTMNGADGVSIVNNKIGTNAAGNAALSNNGGLSLSNILLSLSIQLNQIAGNIGDAMEINTCTGAVIENNLIGTNATGTAVLFNDGTGINLLSNDCRIEGNTIGGFGAFGIDLFNSARTLVRNNRIGADAADNPLPNASQAFLFVVSHSTIRLFKTPLPTTPGWAFR
ncbi:MAG: hypothetical protein HC913_00860 [Microscillaceae bacterium]|nr:hypothetical protein [Microscillaceae bacterium]